MEDNSLKEYKKKRSFRKSPEPSGKKIRAEKSPIFVMQKHDASHLHYDFRLQIKDVLKSWAVPKGPSVNPKEKRLAVLTEDHPIDYADFEGVIPEGQYGAGTVMVWDRGVYYNLQDVSMEEAFSKGRIEVELKGKKIKGGYALIKTGSSKDKKWLLIKMKDRFASARRNPVNSGIKSAISNRTLREIEKGEK